MALSYSLLALILSSIEIRSGQSAESFCLDVSPYCSDEDCWIRPGYAIEYCRKTCGNCQESLCYDSEYFPCVGMDVNGCSKYLKDYCPVLCGICDPVEHEPTIQDDSHSFFSKNSTFLGLFQPSHWIGQRYNPPQSTTKFSPSTTIQPTTVIESGYNELATADISTVPVSITSTTPTFTTAPITTATNSTTTLLTTSSTASSPSTLANPMPNTTPISISNLSTSPAARSTATSNTDTLLSTMTTAEPTSFSSVTMPTENKIFTATMAKAPEGRTTAIATKTITTTQVPRRATPRSLATSTSISSSTANGQEILTTAVVPIAITISPRMNRFNGSEWINYIRQLTQPGRSSKRTPTRGSTVPRAIPQPRPRSNSQMASRLRPLGGAGRANIPRATLSPSSRRLMPSKMPTMTASNRGGFAVAHERQQQHFYQQPPPPPPPPPTAATFLVRNPTTSTLSMKQLRGRPDWRRPLLSQPQSRHTASISDLVTLLGCRDRDERTCSQITEASCHARPGYYLKLCPVKCKNCNGLVCYDSNKIDCAKVVESGGCQLQNAAEYCPQSCDECPRPSYFSDSGSRCKDEFPTCKNLAASGICHHIYNVETLRLYCAKSCGFCKESPYYFMDADQYYPQLMQQFHMRSRS